MSITTLFRLTIVIGSMALTACGEETSENDGSSTPLPDVKVEAQRVAGSYATIRNLSALYLHALRDLDEWQQLNGQPMACETSGTVEVTRSLQNNGDPKAVYEYVNCVGNGYTVNGYLDADLVQDQRDSSGFFQTQVIVDIDINGESYQYENRVVTSRPNTQSANYTLEVIPYSSGKYTNAGGYYISRWTNQLLNIVFDSANQKVDFGGSAWGGASSGGGQLIIRPASGFQAMATPGIGMVAIDSPQSGTITFNRDPESGVDVDGEIRTTGSLANIDIFAAGGNYPGNAGQLTWGELLESPEYDWSPIRSQ